MGRGNAALPPARGAAAGVIGGRRLNQFDTAKNHEKARSGMLKTRCAAMALLPPVFGPRPCRRPRPPPFGGSSRRGDGPHYPYLCQTHGLG